MAAAAESSRVSSVLELTVKFIFVVSILLQTMLWPTVSSICFICIYGIINVLVYFGTTNVMRALTTPGVYVYPPEKKPVNYVLTLIMMAYFTLYFYQFLNHQSQILPTTTFWLDPTIAANYSVQTKDAPLHVDVTSSVSTSMRSNPFEWKRSVQVKAPQIIGTGVPNLPVPCGPGLKYECYAKLWPQSDGQQVPFPSQFYDVDVLIKPMPGVPCTSLEVYRLGMDVNYNVLQPLDYPASTIPNSQNRLPTYSPPCNLFNDTTSNGLCLKVSHTFTHQQYAEEQAAICAKYNQKLILRLPPRGNDVDPEGGRINLDLLLVSNTAASVELSATWNKPPADDSWFLASTFWKQVVESDGVQSWRESTESVAVFFKFLIAAIPAGVTWYYLSVEFLEYISDSQILFLSIFIELPAILLFLSLGAWLPMAGSIVCVLAVNYDASNRKQYWQGYVRPSLLFVKAACNSIQFAWLLALVGQAGWNAFYYSLTLSQLYEMSYRFIITNQSSPTWISMMLPNILILNLAFLIGSAICVVLESIAARKWLAPSAPN